ncbi:MAG: hypothetical protein AAGG55_01130 [Pseudomonadota bacterium]
MPGLRFDIKKDWLIYLFVANYGFMIGRMTLGLWSAEGINIFTSYSIAPDASQLILDANKIYWSKTCFLFSTLLMFSLNVDFRFAVGAAATFWAVSLMVMFSVTPTLIGGTIFGLALCAQQIWRGDVFGARRTAESGDGSGMVQTVS